MKKNMREQILSIFPQEMREIMAETASQGDLLQEIRLRAGREVLVYIDGRERYLQKDGSLSAEPGQAKTVAQEEINELISCVCSSSIYAFEDEISRGYLTLPGGHRMGLAGETVAGAAADHVRTMRYFSSVNIRIAHEVKGAADPVIPWLYREGRFLNTLIISPPCCGKTTLLRDLIRQVSDGNVYAEGQTVGVVDERSELAACFQGIPQNDLGKRTDVLDSCPKSLGMMMLIRSMAPRVVAVDELGGDAEMAALQNVLQCGCSVAATMHGDSIRSAVSRMEGRPGMSAFERYIFLGKENGRCAVLEILDEKYRPLWTKPC